MILAVTLDTILDRERTIHHSVEVVVDTEDEAYTAGSEFWKLMQKFNDGILSEGGES